MVLQFKIFLGSGTTLYEELLQITNATSFDKISNIANNMKEVQSDLEEMKLKTNSIRAYASQLNDGKAIIKKFNFFR